MGHLATRRSVRGSDIAMNRRSIKSKECEDVGSLSFSLSSPVRLVMGNDFEPEESGSSKGGDIERVRHVEEKQNSEGTLFQSRLGFKPARKHLLSRPDQEYAEAVHKDAANVEYTPEEEVSLFFL